ncbi:MAG: glycoside hydrolase family 3 C-terminal domain-containing protein, partial [Chloroflexota bacterium]|nr:glycoside hydrolase family 3 C-terminal domain-containing protein [Chloroflexota bacterium]
RITVDARLDERTLREIYLPPFEAAVQEAGTWGVMSGYNRVNGVYAGEHPGLLRDILKQEWGFEGIVMSDWFGTKSTDAAANNGLDLEMPGPPSWRGTRLLEAVESGRVEREAIDEAARRMLRLITWSGAFEQLGISEERSVDLPEHRAVIRAAGVEGAVLLRNERCVLPLDTEKIRSLAIIGPNAKTAQIMGGGSAQVNAHYAVTPYEGIEAAVGDRVQLGYEIGCTNHKVLPRLSPTLLAQVEAEGGFTFECYSNPDLAGDPVHRATTKSSEQVWLGEVAPGVDPGAFSASMTGRLMVTESGAHTLGLSSAGLTRLYVDGREVIDNWTHQERSDAYFGMGSSEVVASLEMTAGQTYDLRVEYSSRGATMLRGMRLGYLPPVAEDSIEWAAALAARSDAALVFVGLNGDWESEGGDRPDMELVGRQNELVARVTEANPNTVVVLQTGSPVSMPWLPAVAGVLQAWYPGQECGNAIADVLFGREEPSGRLPQTFPMRLEDNPAYINYPGEHGRVRYGEGIYVGYRYYDKKRVEPLFPFGHGLSYTSFSYDRLRLSADSIGPEDELEVSVDLANDGPRRGKEVVQLYVRDTTASVSRPERELKGFAKVELEPGQSTTVTLSLDRTSLAYWDDQRHSWVAEAGEYEVEIGASSRDIRQRATFELTGTSAFGGPGKQQVVFTLESTLREILADDAAAAVLERYLPGFSQSGQLGMAMGFSLTQLAGLSPEQFPEDALQGIERDLQTLRADSQ